MKNVFYVLCALIISSCNSSKSKSTSQTELTSGTYTITKINTDDVTAMNITFILDKGQNRVSGNAACNDYSATITINGTAITTSGMAITKKYCDGKMEVETAYSNAFNSVQSYNKDGKIISLLDGNGNTIIKMK